MSRPNHHHSPYGAGDDDDYSQLTTATRRNDYEDDYEGPILIRVIAPATLQEGYTFDVLVDDEPYTVKVPRGGVKEGQEFDVEYNPEQQPENHRYHHDYEMEQVIEGDVEDESNLKNNPTQTLSGDSQDDEQEGGAIVKGEDETNAIWYDDNGAPIGSWRTHLCSCFDVLTQSTFWMGMCCTPVLMAQLISRLKLTWNGQTGTKEEIALSYNRILLSLVFTMAFFWVPILGWILVCGFYVIVVIYVGTHVRAHMRQKYKIPATLPTRCGQRIDDVCLMFFCGCCSTIQMARHTHDDKEHPGHGCTTTGLGPDAPEIV